MMDKQRILFLLFLGLFCSCNLPKMMLDVNLKANAESYKVSGVNGVQINQVVSFGEFRTGKVKKGWRNTSRTGFIFDKLEAKQKINFDISAQSGEPVVVSCAAKYLEKDLNLFKSKSSFSLSSEDTYTGSIVSSEMAWEFIVSKQQSFNKSVCLAGELSDLKNKVEIYEVHTYDDKYKTAVPDAVGYELKMAGLSVAAVQVINGGNVWIRTGLPDKTRLSIAALCAALLLKPNLDQ